MANFGDPCAHHKLGSFYDPLKFFKKGSPAQLWAVLMYDLHVQKLLVKRW